jgi:iron complex transport system substrate-binding protein
MSRKFNLIILSLAIVLLFAACGPSSLGVSGGEPPNEEITAPVEEPVEDQEDTIQPETITFTDDVDRQVDIYVPAKMIVSLAPSVTETLFAIEAGEQVIGRTDYCDFPEEVTALPSIGGFDASSISVESIVALEPDLVIGGSTYQAEVIQALDDAGIPAFISQPGNLSEIMDTVSLYGQITGHVDEAAAVVEQMQAIIDSIDKTVSTVPSDQRPTIFYEVWHEPLMSTNDSTVVGELIEVAGGVNIFADLPDEYPTVSVEQIVEVDPLFIIGPSSHGDQMSAEVIGKREGWETLTAVTSESIYIVDGNIVSRASPRIVQVLEEFARILHPDLFE